MRWPRYGQMKASGVAWLGEVPGHWDIAPVKSRLVANDGGAWGEDFDDDGVIVLRSTDQTMHGQWSLNEPAKRGLNCREALATRLHVGDLVITKSSGSSDHIGKTTLVNEEIAALECGFSNFMQRLRVDARTHPRFTWYLLNCPIGRAQFDYHSTTSSGLANLTRGTISGLLFTWPPLAAQHVIAAFLDRETARIDALVAAKRRLIALLHEKRAALIARAVTRGLDPDVPTKDSGVAWLGRVPAHWEVGYLRRFASVTDCKHYTVSFADDGLPVASVSELSGNRFSLKAAKRTTLAEYNFLRAGRVPRRGDLLYCRNASVGLVGYIDTDEPFALGQDVCLIDAQGLDGRYLYYQLVSRAVTAQLESKMVGSTFNRINVADIKEFAITWPPPVEQAVIAQYLEEATAHLARQELLACQTIDRLIEYRSTLITSAVTGRIDVRAAA